jgi:hypothetical protein
MEHSKLAQQVTLIACCTLSTILLAMVAVFVIGFFDNRVDNAKLFEVVGPMAQMICGGFIGLITGIKIGSNNEQ